MNNTLFFYFYNFLLFALFSILQSSTTQFSLLQITSKQQYYFCQPSSFINKSMQELTEIQQLYNRIPKQVISKFHTQLSQYSLHSNIQEIDLPTEMDQLELNNLLKNLLETTLDQQTLDKLTFEFLVGGKLLRGQLKSHIVRHEISCEETVQVEYFLAFQNLENEEKIKQDDWVSVLHRIQYPMSGNGFVAGLFSGQGVFYSNERKQMLKVQLDMDCIKAITIQPTTKENQYYLLCGGINEQIKLGLISLSTESNVQSKKSITKGKIQHCTYEELTVRQNGGGAVLSIDTNPIQDGHFCVTGQDGCLSIHQIPVDILEEIQELNAKKTTHNKKKKVHLSGSKHLNFIAKQKIHSGPINHVSWLNSSQILTGSQDHSMKVTDVQTLKPLATFLTKDSITMSLDTKGERILSAHEDGYVRLWDLRTPNQPSLTYKSHSKLVSSVQAHPSKTNLFATGSYDTSLKIWDIRSSFPIQSLSSHHEKVFTVLWKSDKELLGGGMDSQISWHGVQ